MAHGDMTVIGASPLWYATRSSGVVSLVLLTGIVALGVVGVVRLRSDRWPRFLVVGLHRNLTLLALAFLALHVATTVADRYAPIAILDVFVPFVSQYRPIWLGLGTTAFDLLLALTLTSLLRARVGYRAWKALHWLAYAAWPIALVHAMGTGSDARTTWLQVVGGASALLVVTLVAVRLARTARRTMRIPALVAVVAPVAILGWYWAGPARPGWAARAGTPTRLLAAAKRAPAHPGRAALPSQEASILPATAFRVGFRGRLRELPPDEQGQVLVDITGRTTGSRPRVLRIRLRGAPLDSGGITMTASGASFGSAAAPHAYLGHIVHLEGSTMLVSLRGPSGALRLTVQLQTGRRSGEISGIVSGMSGTARA